MGPKKIKKSEKPKCLPDEDISESEQSELSDSEFPIRGGATENNDNYDENVNENVNENFDDADADADDDDKDGDKDDEIDDEKDDESETESLVKDDEKDDNVDDDCVYDFEKKNNLFDNEDDDDATEDFFDDDDEIQNKYVSDENRITTRKLTKYERVNIIGTRAKQISMGAQKMVETSIMDPKKIAKLELEMKVCPLKLKRTLPSGEIELISVNSLKIIN